MNFSISERKTKRIKRTILENVFKENLRMVGKEDYHTKRHRVMIIMMMGVAILLGTALYIFLKNSTNLDHSFFQYERLSLASSGSSGQRNDLNGNSKHQNDLIPSQYSAFLSESQIPLRKIFGLKVKTIIIDPGHGGEDSGAVGKLGTKEKDMTLDIAKKLRKRLQKHEGYRILMTREDDRTRSLEERIDFANSNGGDLYISIHVNYIPSKPIDIIETYYFGLHKNKATLELAEKENRGTQYTLSDFKEIIKKIGNTLKTQESNLLAQSIQKSLYRNIKKQNKYVKNWGVKTAPFVVLLGVDVPSVLSEVTCLSNRKEEKKLSNIRYRGEIARYLEEGIVNYLDKNINNKGDNQNAAERISNKKR